MADFDPELANTALGIATQWGPSRVTPLVNRLAAVCNSTQRSDLERYSEMAKRVEKQCYELVQAQVDALALRDPGAVDASCRNALMREYPWLSEENLSRLLTIGRFYAAK